MEIKEPQVRQILNNWDSETGERLLELFLERYAEPFTTGQILEFLGISEALT